MNRGTRYDPADARFRTKDEIRTTFAVSRMRYDITIPKGTRCRRIREGSTIGKFWVDDLSWIDRNDGFLMHDATHYGIVLEPEQVEAI